MIDMVLSTDMSKHAQFLGEFKDLTQKTHGSHGSAVAGSVVSGDEGCSGDDVPAAGSPEEAAAFAISESLASSYEKRALVLCSIIHSADLGNCAKEWSICQTWVCEHPHNLASCSLYRKRISFGWLLPTDTVLENWHCLELERLVGATGIIHFAAF